MVDDGAADDFGGCRSGIGIVVVLGWLKDDRKRCVIMDYQRSNYCGKK